MALDTTQWHIYKMTKPQARCTFDNMDHFVVFTSNDNPALIQPPSKKLIMQVGEDHDRGYLTPASVTILADLQDGIRAWKSDARSPLGQAHPTPRPALLQPTRSGSPFIHWIPRARGGADPGSLDRRLRTPPPPKCWRQGRGRHYRRSLLVIWMA